MATRKRANGTVDFTLFGINCSTRKSGRLRQEDQEETCASQMDLGSRLFTHRYYRLHTRMYTHSL
jgi:hypothetical protein